MASTHRTRGPRLRRLLDRFARPTFTVALIASMAIGTLVVLVQFVGALAGAGGLVTGVAETVGPVAFVLAAVACVVSLVFGYSQPRPHDEENDT